jgi:hypothetical protein
MAANEAAAAAYLAWARATQTGKPRRKPVKPQQRPPHPWTAKAQAAAYAQHTARRQAEARAAKLRQQPWRAP